MDGNTRPPAHVFHRFHNMFPLEIELLLVIEVLPGASAAKPAVRTWRIDSEGRGMNECNDPCLGVGLLFPENLGLHFVTRQGFLDEDGHAVDPGKPSPPINQGFDFELYRLSSFYGHRLLILPRWESFKAP